MRALGKVATTMLAGMLIVAVGTIHAAAPINDPDLAVDEWPQWPYKAGCYGPPFDPIAVFSRSATAELGSLPTEVALRGIINDPQFSWLGFAQHSWRSVSESEEEAVFVNDFSWIRLERDGDAWKLAGNGGCVPRTTIHGLGAVPWTLSVGHPARRKTTKHVWVDLGPGPCASGMSQNTRARKPIFRQFGKRLVMTILLDPLPPGHYTCQGILDPPLRVTLPGRLGARTLFDGGTFPPGDVMRIWRERTARERAARR